MLTNKLPFQAVLVHGLEMLCFEIYVHVAPKFCERLMNINQKKLLHNIQKKKTHARDKGNTH